MKTIALPIFLLVAACSAQTPAEHVLSGNTMGTQYTVKVVHEPVEEAALQTDVETSFAQINRMMSTFLADSEISRFNISRSTAWQPVSLRFCESVEQAEQISSFTDGAFDITVAPLVNLWGFGPGKITDTPPTDDEIAALMPFIGYENLHTNCDTPALKKDIPELMLDMSAFGKGLAVDYIARLLDDRGIGNYLVEVGGELRLRGHNGKGQKWAIGVEKPLTGERRPETIVHLSDTALATSGDYRNFFINDGQRYSHTIDTRTGRPVTHNLASVTIVDDSGSRADALATALLVMGPDRGMELALRENLAVLFLLRDESGIEERSTPAFDKVRSNG